MTIDEFMAGVSPKMRQGWVAMDESGDWFWYMDKPEIKDCGYFPFLLFRSIGNVWCIDSLELFCRKVRNNE